MLTPFRDRIDAGKCLAKRLAAYAGRADVVVLALPRGGVPVGFEVASALGAPWTYSWCASWGSPGERNWRWVPSPREESACSTATWSSL